MAWQRMARRVVIGLVATGGLAVLASCDPPPPPRAFTVDVSTDSVDAHPGDGICADAAGHCSLRAAIGENDVLPVSGMTEITLATDVDLSIGRTTADNDTGDLDISGRVWLIGEGHTIDAHAIDRVIHQHSGDLAVRDLTITGGSVTDDGATGGGILAEGNLVMMSTTVTGNQAAGAGSSGGGISVSPTAIVVLSQTTIDQSAAPIGAGLFVGGGQLAVGNSTISGGSGTDGSAVAQLDGTVELRGVTVFDRSGGTAVHVSGGSLSMRGSIIDSAATACQGTVTSGGYNAATDATCGLDQVTDLPSTDPQLGPLADNGGPTFTHLPGVGSPAINAIPAGASGLCADPAAIDQRGAHRPFGVRCDIGSVEAGASPDAPLFLVVDSASDAPDASVGDGACDDGSGHCTLRAAIDETNANPFDDVISIATGIDPTLTIAGEGDDANDTGDLDITGSLTIHGGGATLDAGHLDRGVDQLAGALAIDDLTITGGLLTSGHGGGIQSAAGLELSLHRTTIRDNAATDLASGNGGGLMAGPGATVEMVESTVSGNRGSYGGGASINGSATISRSTFSGNDGGALALAGAPSSVVNSTFSANSSTVLGSAIAAQGQLELVSSTLVGGGTNLGNQATLYGAFGGSIAVRGSVVDMPIFRACYGNIVSQGYNISSDVSCSFTQPTDRAGTLPLLRPLEDNGGPTLTHIPQLGSPATQSIPNGTPGLCDGSIPTDQRGITRPVSGLCDIGAVEGAGTALVPSTYTVDTAVDKGDATVGDGVCDDGTGHCSLRAAVDESNASWTDDTIVIAAGIDPTLSIAGPEEDANATGDLDLLGRVTIHGGGATLDAASLDRGIQALAGPVSIDHLTVTHGRADENAGGIYANAAITLDHVAITDNVLFGVDTAGAGLRGFGPTTIVDSTISGNTARTSSGAFLQGTTTIVRTVISGNTSTDWGPTLFLEDAVTIDASTISGNTAREVPGIVIQQGSLEVRNSTISGNTATAQSLNLYGSAITNSFGSTITVLGSTVTGDGPGWTILTGGTQGMTIAGSIVANGVGPACSGPATSGGWNLAGDVSCGLVQVSDHQSVDALLGPLAANGGTTPTRLPGLGSLAIDAVPVGTAGLCDGTLAADQRGVARPQGGACDIGAVEQ